MENYNNLDHSIDLDALKKRLEANRATPTDGEETRTVGGDFASRINNTLTDTVTNNNDVVVSDTTTNGNIPYYATDNFGRRVDTLGNLQDSNKQYSANTTEDTIHIPGDTNALYTGPGLVINNADLAEKEVEIPKYTGITPDTQSSIDAYLADMDADIEMLKETAEENGYKPEEPESDDEDENPGMTKDEFNTKYNEAVVVIDKSGFGRVINFTDEEHEKLEKVKKIKLEEVETVSLDTIRTKKPKKKDIDKIIKRVTSITTTNIVLPISGYTAEMKGCSAYELISLIDSNDNALLNAQNKWSLIHNKLENTSLGKMDFNEFLMNTAASDYNTFIYGLLCSTYPDDDSIPLTCEKCGKPFDHKYSVRSLIRAEAMSEKLQDTVMTVVDNSVSEQSAKRVHDESLISYVKRIKLPHSGIIAEIYVQSAYDLINKSIKDLSENQDEKYAQTAVLATLINTFYVPDPDEPDTYFEVDTGADIAKTLYTLNEIDILVIRKMGENLLNDMTISYGFMNITCPHCKNYIPFIEMDLENILFYRYRQALSTVID